MMGTLVMKFGGAAVATPRHFLTIADIIIERKKEYDRIVIVVSAMANQTDQLIALAKEIHPEPPSREYDMLVSVGERISISLLAMALSLKGQSAISFTGSQSGIITCEQHSQAKIVDVRPFRLLPILEAGTVVIVAGFQGVSRQGEITTLGRNGSDVSAVALAVALGADRVEFYKDVKGIFEADPKLNPQARCYPYLHYRDAIAIAEKGAKVLHPRCISLAEKNGLPLQILSFHDFLTGGRDGTMIFDPDRCPNQPSYEEIG